MRTVHEALIHASPEAIFAVAADVERWPALHHAYRWCRVVERQPSGLVFEMAGWIRGWPARWRAVQERFPDEHRIIFRHVRGITTGMIVEWRLHPAGTDTRVTLLHDLVMRWPLIGRLVSDFVVGPVFIDWIARQTLHAVRAAVEGRNPKFCWQTR